MYGMKLVQTFPQNKNVRFNDIQEKKASLDLRLAAEELDNFQKPS